MTGDQTKQGQRPCGNRAVIAAAVALTVFLVNVIVGKVSLLLGASTPIHIGDVAEFLLLGFAVVCFVIGILAKEQAAQAQSDRSTGQSNQSRST